MNLDGKILDDKIYTNNLKAFTPRLAERTIIPVQRKFIPVNKPGTEFQVQNPDKECVLAVQFSLLQQ